MTQGSSQTTSVKDYRERYQELTGRSLIICPRCQQGRMVIVENLPPARCRIPFPRGLIMKHRNQLTKRIAMELAFPVDRRGMREPLRKDSPQPISMDPRFHRPTKTTSKPCCLPPAGSVAHVHPSHRESIRTIQCP